MSLVAFAVALLLPDDVAARAVKLSEALAGGDSDRLKLDSDHLPHVTLVQHFIREEETDAALAHVHGVIERHAPLKLRVTGARRANGSIWLALDRSPQLDGLHGRLMAALRRFERQGGTSAAFFDGDARARDVIYVNGYRAKSAFGSFTPHVTLGHAPAAPTVVPFEFDASTVAACHLGRSCTCRRILRQWTL